MISLENVSFTYGGSAVEALRGISLDVAPGRKLAVLGSNGSGKSTLARLMNGLLLPSTGRVTVDGMSTSDPQRELEIRSKVGMVFQNPDDQIVATSVEDDVAFGPENLGLARDEIRRRVDIALAETGLTGFERREPHLLSGGQRQRLAIAGALAMEPDYLVLDEPTSMIDAQGRREVMTVLDRLRDRGQAVVLVTHDLADAMRADDVLVLSSGEIVFVGTPLQLLGDVPLLDEWGLALTPLLSLTSMLRARGLDVPLAAAGPTAVVESLCR